MGFRVNERPNHVEISAFSGYGIGVVSEVPALGILKGCLLSDLSLSFTFSLDRPTVQSD